MQNLFTHIKQLLRHACSERKLDVFCKTLSNLQLTLDVLCHAFATEWN